MEFFVLYTMITVGIKFSINRLFENIIFLKLNFNLKNVMETKFITIIAIQIIVQMKNF